MRVRPTLQPGYGAARMRPEIGTVINLVFSKKVTYSCVGISTAINGSFGLRHVSLGGLTGQFQFQLLV